MNWIYNANKGFQWKSLPQDESVQSLRESFLVEMRCYVENPGAASASGEVSGVADSDKTGCGWISGGIWHRFGLILVMLCLVIAMPHCSTSSGDDTNREKLRYGHADGNGSPASVSSSRGTFLPWSNQEWIIQNPNSPQARGIEWVKQHPDFPVMPDWRRQQLMAIATMLIATCGPTVMANYNLGTHECDWEKQLGFDPHCTKEPLKQGRIQKLQQPSCGFTGNKKNKHINWELPPEVALLTDLTDLHLHFTQLEGTIPTQLGLLTKLSWLGLGHNQLTGSIPSELGALKELETCFLLNNPTTGSLPSELGLWTALEKLAMGDNGLTGSLPTQFGNWKNAQEVLLNTNQLSGSIPTEFFHHCTHLQHLRLEENHLLGSIPSTLGSLTQMTILALDENQLTGPIPSEVGLLTGLSSLELGQNHITGTIPCGKLDEKASILVDCDQVDCSCQLHCQCK